MNYRDFCLQHLPEHLDERGDLAPPWEQFPEYERHTIGWRMGSGESWLGYFSVFLEQLGTDFDTRLAYLKRHARAPFTWSGTVYWLLHPDAPDEDDEDDDDGELERQRVRERRKWLLERELIVSDVAYSTWRAKQKTIVWPWEFADTPVVATRHWTRDMWFWSRHVAEARAKGNIPEFNAPEEWLCCADAIRYGATGPIVPDEGLLSLARCFASGNVIAPWQAGLTMADFKDSFDDDMGYVDAFRLWGMSAFDDVPMIERYAEATRMPREWGEWMAEQFPLD